MPIRRCAPERDNRAVILVADLRHIARSVHHIPHELDAFRQPLAHSVGHRLQAISVQVELPHER
jgi:hypothetical protein